MIKLCLRALHKVFLYAKGTVILAITLSLLSGASVSIKLYVTERLVNAITLIGKDNAISSITIWGIILVLSLLLVYANQYAYSMMNIVLIRKLSKTFLPEVIKKFIRIEYKCLEDPAVFDCIQRMSAVPHEKLLSLFNQVVGIVRYFISLMGILIYFLSISPLYAVIYFLIIGVMLFYDVKMAHIHSRVLEEQSEKERKMQYIGGLLTSKNSIFEFQVFGVIGYMIEKWKRIAKIVLKENTRLLLKTEKLAMLSTGFMVLFAFFSIIFISLGIYSGRFRIGLLIAYLSAMGQIFIQAESFSNSFQQAGVATLEMRHYEQFIALPEIDTGSEILPDIMDIVFESVCFRYPGTERDVLKNLSFHIKMHENIAVVGENGAGKSTIIKLMLGIYKPDSGCIKIGNTPISSLSTQARQMLFSAVFQDYACYFMTLRENVAMSYVNDLKIDARIYEALEFAGISPLLVHSGLDTPLGKFDNHGVDLSGGEWQKVALARAAFHKARYYILDEPVAALDPIAESQVYENFIKMTSMSKGVIIISHRMASARFCDRILVLTNGSVAEEGSHEVLLAHNGIYAAMYNAQSAWYRSGVNE